MRKGIFRYYESKKSFENKRVAFKRAQIMAAELPPNYILETNIIGTMDLAESIWHIAEILATNNLDQKKDQRNTKMA